MFKLPENSHSLKEEVNQTAKFCSEESKFQISALFNDISLKMLQLAVSYAGNVCVT